MKKENDMEMTSNEQIVENALREGFSDAAVIDTDSIVFDASFRRYCEENLCGRYGANYSCPPDCGSPCEMRQKIMKYKHALVLRTVAAVKDINDADMIKSAKISHNAHAERIAEQMKKHGYNGLTVGASCCTLCNPCLKSEGRPCAFPQRQFSCMSAYCIFVKDLAGKCGMIYDYKDGALPLFGMYVYNSAADGNGSETSV